MFSRWNVILTSFRTSTKVYWFFDSESSEHMTGDKSYIYNLKAVGSKKVTFGDGATGKIVGKGKLQYLGLPWCSSCWRSYCKSY